MLDGADEALLCTAFVDTRGIGLLRRQLAQLGSSARLAATSTFTGDRTVDALAEASRDGIRTRIVNTSGGTFHPKVVVARHGTDDVALVGSTNITNGLAVNVEAAVVVTGSDTAQVRDVAESWWASGVELGVAEAAAAGDRFEPDVLAMLRRHVGEGTTVLTVSDQSPNRVERLDERGIWVSTERSLARGRQGELVPPWMVTLGWEVLRSSGRLTNAHLLNELHVHRSSAVCALLSNLPGVQVASRRPIELRLVDLALAAEPAGTYDA